MCVLIRVRIFHNLRNYLFSYIIYNTVYNMLYMYLTYRSSLQDIGLLKSSPNIQSLGDAFLSILQIMLHCFALAYTSQLLDTPLLKFPQNKPVYQQSTSSLRRGSYAERRSNKPGNNQQVRLLIHIHGLCPQHISSNGHDLLVFNKLNMVDVKIPPIQNWIMARNG